MKFEITPAAERFIRLMLRADGGLESGFRLVVSPGGCAGLSADISVRGKPEKGDVIIERNDIRIFLPEQSESLLEGVTIDFADTAAQTGLLFRDPRGSSCSSSGVAVR